MPLPVTTATSIDLATASSILSDLDPDRGHHTGSTASVGCISRKLSGDSDSYAHGTSGAAIRPPLPGAGDYCVGGYLRRWTSGCSPHTYADPLAVTATAKLVLAWTHMQADPTSGEDGHCPFSSRKPLNGRNPLPASPSSVATACVRARPEPHSCNFPSLPTTYPLVP